MPEPGGKPLRKIDFRGAVAHCAPPPPESIRELQAAVERSDDPRAYVDQLLEQARRAA